MSHNISEAKIPYPWKRTGSATRFFSRLADAPCSVLMLDYDGTLAPFQEDRLQAHPYDGVRERLEQLLGIAPTGVVLISGRKARELQSLIGLSRPVEIWGSHGREHLSIDGDYAVDALTSSEQSALDKIQRTLALEYPNRMLECKPNSIAVHWRDSTSRKEEIRLRVQQLFEETECQAQGDGKLQLLPFDGGVEVRAGEVTKGDAVRKILSRLPDDAFAAFLGDDTTDEDAFKVLRSTDDEKRSLTVLVGNEPRVSAAELSLRAPEQLLEFVDDWIAAIIGGASTGAAR